MVVGLGVQGLGLRRLLKNVRKEMVSEMRDE